MKKSKIILYILIAITIIVNLVFIVLMPDTVPVHWGVDGNPDRFGSKYEILIFSGISILTLLLPIIKKNEKDEKQLKLFNFALILMQSIFLVICIIFSISALTYDTNKVLFDVSKIIMIIMGALFILLGNIMPKIKRNKTFGFRSYWSLYNDVTWQKSQRFTGYSALILGLIMIICGLAFSSLINAIVLISALVLFIITNFLAAYIYYKHEKQKELIQK